MLITKEVEVEVSSRNSKYYEDKDYKISRYIDNKGRNKIKRGTKILVNVNDLSKGSEVSIDIECDGCSTPRQINWEVYNRYVKDNGEYYCQKCSKKGKYKKYISFEEWCYINLSKEEANLLLSRWDYNLNIDKNGNKLSPKDVTYGSTGIDGKGYWFKCLKHPEHGSEQKI